jgi:hypothetical protein
MKNKELEADEQGYYYIHKWVSPPYPDFINWSDIPLEDYYCIYCIHRDAYLLDRSNYICLAKMCGIDTDGLGNDGSKGDLTKAFLYSTSCSLVGWRQYLMVHCTNKELLDKMEHEMYELTQYPIVDECHYGELEYHEVIEYGNVLSERDIKDIVEAVGVEYVEGRGIWEYPDDSGDIYERVRCWFE